MSHKSRTLALLFAVVLVGASFSHTTGDGPPEWLPAKVYSITVGASTLDQLTHTTGRPKQQVENDNGIMWGTLLYQYDVTWPVEGQLWARVDAHTKRVVQLMFKPKKARMSDIVKTFGSVYQIKRYRSQRCEKGNRGLTLCADTSGAVLVFEYPEQGVVAFPGPSGSLGDVYFVAEPLDLLSCQCEESQRK